MKKPQRVFLLGASGMGMAPLAFYLSGAGVEVEAFDDYFRDPCVHKWKRPASKSSLNLCP